MYHSYMTSYIYNAKDDLGVIDGPLYHNDIVLIQAIAVSPLPLLVSHPFKNIHMTGNFPRTLNKRIDCLLRCVSNVRKSTQSQG